MSPAEEPGETQGIAVPLAEMTQADRKIAALRNYYEALQLVWAMETAAAQAALLAGASEGEIEAIYERAAQDEAEGSERPEPGHERT